MAGCLVAVATARQDREARRIAPAWGEGRTGGALQNADRSLDDGFGLHRSRLLAALADAPSVEGAGAHPRQGRTRRFRPSLTSSAELTFRASGIDPEVFVRFEWLSADRGGEQRLPISVAPAPRWAAIDADVGTHHRWPETAPSVEQSDAPE
jgi:hypothetical protein